MAIEQTINLAPTTEESSSYQTSNTVSTRDFKVLRRKVDGTSAALTVAQGEIDLRVTYDDVINAINISEEGIIIQANRVNLTGLVTFSNLSTSGQTTISGDNITTGTLNASVCNVTNINATNISTGTLNASRVVAGYLSSGSISGWTIGSNSITSPGGTIVIGSSGGNNITLGGTGTGGGTINLSGAQIYNYANGIIGMSGGLFLHGHVSFYSNAAYDIGTASVRPRNIYANNYLYAGNISSGDIYPVTDNLEDLGSSSLRWDDVYATNATIQTSDINLKTDIEDIQNGVDLILKIKPVQYRFKDRERRHYGFISQWVKQSMDEVNIPDAAVFIAPDEGYQGLRYGELIAPMVQTIQHLDARIKELENRTT